MSKISLPTRTLRALEKKHIVTNDDLARFVPRAYLDYRVVRSIAEIPDNTYGAAGGRLLDVDKRQGKTGVWYLVLRVQQADGNVFRVMMFSKSYLFGHYSLMKEKTVVICGKVSHDDTYGDSITDPDILVEQHEFRPGILPVYSKIKGVSEQNLRELVKNATEISEEILEPALLTDSGLPGYRKALRGLHDPKTVEDIRDGRKRLLYNDLLFFSMLLLTEHAQHKSGTPFWLQKRDKTDAFIEGLPFALTADQGAVLENIIAKGADGWRNNVLIQGDVGCGKTIVAIAAMLCAHENGYQSVLMAPRGVLASQHYADVCKYLDTFGVRSVFLHAGLRVKEKKEIIERIREGDTDVVVGTHSCLSDGVEYARLGLIVTDEEHLFGVQQKEMLAKKAGEGVHQLSMSATPIPRTLATILYGEDKEIAVIREMPEGRLPIKTAAVSDRTPAMRFLEKQIAAGRQAYVVCPLIEENDELDLLSLNEAYAVYNEYFVPRGIKIGAVNGRMDEADIKAAVDSFISGETKILLSTTVIEVGVNVPNATVMVIEQAERFGLASLHQLRGRVGRGSDQSYCVLISEDTENERIKTIVSTTDGFEIAEADLALRGTGDLIGTEQAGMNKYVQLMLDHREFYEAVKERAKFALEHGFGRRLLAMYRENGR